MSLKARDAWGTRSVNARIVNSIIDARREASGNGVPRKSLGTIRGTALSDLVVFGRKLAEAMELLEVKAPHQKTSQNSDIVSAISGFEGHRRFACRGLANSNGAFPQRVVHSFGGPWSSDARTVNSIIDRAEKHRTTVFPESLLTPFGEHRRSKLVCSLCFDFYRSPP